MRTKAGVVGGPQGTLNSERLLASGEGRVDPGNLQAFFVRSVLGTSTTKATVNGALEEVLALAARRRALLDGDAVAGSSDLADDEQRRAAWA
ncbi:MAG: hypothetical protein ACREQM_00405 [Candidatus Dormibacteraceae bacterium]